MPNQSLAYQEALRLLSDGQWHDYREVVRKIATTVIPGRALEQAERMRLARAMAEGTYQIPEERKLMKSDERLIEIGATAIARSVLAGSVLFEIEPRGKTDDGTKRVRIKPERLPLQSRDGK